MRALRIRGLIAALGPLAVLACQTPQALAPVASVAANRPPEPDLPCPQGGPPTPGNQIRWFHDDYPAALSCAVETGRPLVLDLWAPWCHTCLSMQHYVLTDPAFAPLAERFVWLAVDTDRAVNAPVVERFVPSVWPTFLVVSPDQSVQARYLGAASVGQFRAFLLEGERAQLDASALPADDPIALLRRGDRAAMGGDLVVADAAYAEALSRAPLDWARRPDALVSLLGVRYRRGIFAECVGLAASELDNTGRSASAADFAYYAQLCASAGEDQKRAVELRQKLVARLRPLLDDPAAPLSLDDRSDGLRILREILESQGEAAAARLVAERQRTLLDQAAAEAPDALAASTFNWPRAEVYVYLSQGRELVAELGHSVEALPDDYDPPYRLAWLWLQLGDAERALAPAEQALRLCYGPRQVRVQRLVAKIQLARGDVDAERVARERVIQRIEALPETQRRPGDLERARAELAALGEVGALD